MEYKLIYTVTRFDSDVEEVEEEVGETPGTTTTVEPSFEETYQVTHTFEAKDDEEAQQTAEDIIDESAFDIMCWALNQGDREVASEV